jgi:RNA polymerase sigma factor (sigma-70 family)
MEPRDAQLVARARDGDHDAWRAIVERYARYIYAIAQSFRLRQEDVEDVFQDVFARAYEHLGRLRDDDALRPWLAALTRRVCIDRLRRGGREDLSAELEQEGVDDRIDELTEAFAVHEALAGLPANCREILDRFFARDESYRDIGQALELPSGTIASRISRCLARLREAFAEETDDEARLEDR